MSLKEPIMIIDFKWIKFSQSRNIYILGIVLHTSPKQLKYYVNISVLIKLLHSVLYFIVFVH